MSSAKMLISQGIDCLGESLDCDLSLLVTSVTPKLLFAYRPKAKGLMPPVSCVKGICSLAWHGGEN